MEWFLATKPSPSGPLPSRLPSKVKKITEKRWSHSKLYHVIFGRPAFHSFHAKPCYIYNQLKMRGPDGIITIYGSFRKAKECEEGKAAFTEVVFFGEEFKEIHATTDPAEMPTSKQEVSASPRTFKPIVDTKQVELVTGDATKTTSIRTNLSPK
jgi:hypothetical protein